MATPKKKLPDHVYPHLDLAETHAARIAEAMKAIEGVMTDKRGINRHMLEKLHARIGESIAMIIMALSLIERREPLPAGVSENGARLAVDRSWLLAMNELAMQGQDGIAKSISAFIHAKLVEIDEINK